MANKGISKKAIAIAILAATMAVSFITASALGDTTDNANNDTLSATDTINTNDILKTAGIELNGDDKIIRTDDDGVVSMTIFKAFDVTINYNGQAYSVTMAKGTVADALRLAGIKLKNNEKVSPSLDTEVNKNTEITIDDSVKVKITFNGIQDTYTVPNGNVKQALESLGVKVDKYDKITPKKSTKLEEGMEIEYTDVEIEKVTQTKAVDYKIKKIYDKTLKKGSKKIKTQGVEGEKTVVIKETYNDGELVNSEEVSSEITKKPVTQVEIIGTKQAKKKAAKKTASKQSAKKTASKKKTTKKASSTQQETTQNEVNSSAQAVGGNTFTDNAGNVVSYSQVLTGSGTAYTAPPGSGTATGVTVSVGCVAVNPNIIPYGSRLYIESCDGSYVYGYATAVDTGGALMDGSAIVDLFMNTYDDCAVFGRRQVNVYVLN